MVGNRGREGGKSRFYIKLDVVHDWMLLPNDSFVSSFTACTKKDNAIAQEPFLPHTSL